MEKTTACGGRRRLAQAITLALGLTAVTTAMSQTIAFDVPGQEAATAIPEFARQAGLQIIAPADKLKGVKTHSLHGAIDTRAALKLLLEGTGLTVASDDGHTISLRFPEGAGNTTSKVTPAVGSGRLAAADTVSTAGQRAAANPQPSAAAVQNSSELGEIVVTGIRSSITSARAIKRDSQGIVDAIAPEDIGKLPDTNLAESLQRITGVSIDRSGGEGEFITIRGFGPEFNTVLLNGRQMATATDPTQASGRAFSFDVLASELVSGVQVYKSSTARLQSGGVGSTVNIKTARPFDFSGFKFSGSADMNHDQNTGKSAPDASFLISDLFADGKFGALLSGSYQKRKDELKAATTDGWIVNGGTPTSAINGGAGVAKTASNPQGNIFVPQDFGSQEQFETRERIGGTLVLQYKPNDNLTLTSDTLYSKFTNTTDTRSYGHWFTASNLSNVLTDANGTVTDMTQSVGQASDFHDKKYDKKTNLVASGLNADWNITDRLNLSIDASFSQSKEDPNGGKESELALLGIPNQTITYKSDGAVLPYTTGFINTGGVVGGTSPLFQHVMLLRGYAVDDQIGQLRFDFTYKGDSPTEGLVKLNWGGYFSRDNKDTSLYSNDGGTGCTTCGYNFPAPPNVPIGVFNAGSNFLSGVSGSNRLPTQWLTFDAQTLFNAITAQQRLLNPAFTFAPPKINDSLVLEKVFGGYLESEFAGTLAGRKFSTVVGVRVEETQAFISGLATQFVALHTLANDATQYGVTTAGTSTVSSSTSYTDVLPNLSFRWDLTDALIARFAASETMTRPTLEQLSPVTTLVTLRPGNFAASSGNPDLQPFKSNNLDISAEYYYDKSNYVSLGWFYKNVSNFIVLNQTTGPVNNNAKTPLLDPATGLPAQFSITAPLNGPTAVVTGEEAAIQHSFWDTGFGVQLNGTRATSDKKLNTADLSNKFAVTGLSNSANAVVFYDKGAIEGRVAVNWRDKFLQYLTPPPINGAGQAVTQVRARYQLDASATYHINKNFAVFGEGVNLTNTPVLQYAYYENQFLKAEDSGTRFKIGFRAGF
jgi:iron complex outermembrane recepter protein